MNWHTPHFWYQHTSGLKAKLLSPAAAIYGFFQRQKIGRGQEDFAYKADMPVICVGNATAGGSGKTPTVQSLCRMICHDGPFHAPCIISRGYGGRIKQAHLVGPQDSAADVGDEALLLAEIAPVIIARDRAKGAKLAEEYGFDIILMDDGYQNFSLHKDLNILVIDGRRGFGNQRMIPAGPLREPLDGALARADMAVILNEDRYGCAAILENKVPFFTGRIATEFKPNPREAYIGFCGLGDPQKFKRTLTHELRLGLDDFIAFPDHYPYQKKDVDLLLQRASKSQVRLITTAKDAARLQDFPEIYGELDIVPVFLEWDAPDHLRTFIYKKLEEAATS